MNHYFGSQFKQLRKNHDWTQEQIAEMLTVSPQAVGKWEAGKSFPDISLLPIIANLFCVSVDSLLGVDISKKEQNIEAILAEAVELQEKDRYADAVSLLRKALTQYPAEPRIMYRLAWNIRGIVPGDHQYLRESISIYERILEICDDPRLRARTMRDLMYAYASVDDEKKALEIAETFPDFAFCKEYLLGRSNLLYGRELAVYLQKNILLYGNAMKECLEYFLHDRVISEADMHPYTIEMAKCKMDLLNQILE